MKAIASALEQPYRPLEIVVVDSASTDGTVEAIKVLYPDVNIIKLHRNLGCPEGRNIALVNCSGEIIFSLDDDGWLEPSTLQLCVEYFRKDEKIGVVACRIVAPDEAASTHHVDEQLTHTFSGGASAIRREVLEKAGYYPSDFFRQAEEGELALRILDKGYTILSSSRAIMFHARSQINRHDKLFHFYNCRNEITTVVRLYPFFLVPLGVIQKSVSWNLLGIRKGALIYTLAGMLSALVRIPRLLTERDPISFETARDVLLGKVGRRLSKLKNAKIKS